MLTFGNSKLQSSDQYDIMHISLFNLVSKLLYSYYIVPAQVDSGAA